MKIISRLHGRLGNVMFQIATNLFYAKKYNYEPSFCFSNAIYHSKDLEFFISNTDGLQPKGYDIPLEDIQNPYKKESCSDSNNSEAYSCTAWIVKNSWKIPRNYPWK